MQNWNDNWGAAKNKDLSYFCRPYFNVCSMCVNAPIFLKKNSQSVRSCTEVKTWYYEMQGLDIFHLFCKTIFAVRPLFPLYSLCILYFTQFWTAIVYVWFTMNSIVNKFYLHVHILSLVLFAEVTLFYQGLEYLQLLYPVDLLLLLSFW